MLFRSLDGYTHIVIDHHGWDTMYIPEKVGITMANISILKNGKAKAIRFTTLDKICEVLECQPGDILEYTKDDK